MFKIVNLAKAIQNNKRCLGFIWKFDDDTYGYQNDNDLGLDLEPLDFRQKYKKKIKVNKDYFVYELPDTHMSNDGTGAPLLTVIALAKECHNIPMDIVDENLCKEYWDR